MPETTTATKELLVRMAARLARGAEYTLEDAYELLGVLIKDVEEDCFTTGVEKWQGIRDCVQRLEVLRARACNTLIFHDKGSRLFELVHEDRKLQRLAQRILAYTDRFGIENARYYAWENLPHSDFLAETLDDTKTLDSREWADMLLLDTALINQFLVWVEEYRELWAGVVEQLRQAFGPDAKVFEIEAQKVA